MSYQLSDKTKKIISEEIGLSFEELIEINDIKEITKKQIKWPEDGKVGELRIKTIEAVNKKINQKKEDFER